MIPQRNVDNNPMLVKCWAEVYEPALGQPLADLEFKQLTDKASCKESQSPDSPVCANPADLSEAVPKHW